MVSKTRIQLHHVFNSFLIIAELSSFISKRYAKMFEIHVMFDLESNERSVDDQKKQKTNIKCCPPSLSLRSIISTINLNSQKN